VAIAISLVALVLSVGAYVGYRTVWDQHDQTELALALERLEHVIDRIETATNVAAADLLNVISDLADAKEAAETVASDLASAQERADKVVEGLPGEAADAGAQSEKP
jgi:hypothetical protein